MYILFSNLPFMPINDKRKERCDQKAQKLTALQFGNQLAYRYIIRHRIFIHQTVQVQAIYNEIHETLQNEWPTWHRMPHI